MPRNRWDDWDDLEWTTSVSLVANDDDAKHLAGDHTRLGTFEIEGWF
jgi:hypothetical protein